MDSGSRLRVQIHKHNLATFICLICRAARVRPLLSTPGMINTRSGRRMAAALSGFRKREGVPNLYQKAASGVGQDEVLLRSAYRKEALDWSTDGRFILYTEEIRRPRVIYGSCQWKASASPGSG